MKPNSNQKNTIQAFVSIAIVISITLIIFFYSKWQNEKADKKKLYQEKKKVELEIKLYKQNIKDEELQEKIQSDVDSLHNAIEFFSSGSDSL